MCIRYPSSVLPHPVVPKGSSVCQPALTPRSHSQIQEIPSPHSVSTGLPSWDTSSTWDHTKCVYLWLLSLGL